MRNVVSLSQERNRAEMRRRGMDRYDPSQDELRREDKFISAIWRIFSRYDLVFVVSKVPIILANLLRRVSETEIDMFLSELTIMTKEYHSRISDSARQVGTDPLHGSAQTGISD